MAILDDDVARVREATDLVALAGEHIALKRVGQRYMGLCPFHAEKTPSFSINPSLGLFFCFGCQRSGDAITFIREVEHLDFVDAVERLAARAGITLRYDVASVSKDRKRNARLNEAVGAAIAFYHRLLVEAPEGGAARKYLRGRGFDGDAARRFSLGWAPDDFDALSVHLQHSGFDRRDVVDAGLAFVNRVNKLQDQFRARLMFPIYDSRGEPVGFGGRALGDQIPKYKNSPETPLYRKSRLLYGLNWAKGEIVARGEAVICEGYTDVMAFALAGAPNTVATCGTAVTDEHVQVLKNLARRMVLAFDADSAGQAAADRWYQWEQSYEIEVRVADLPPGGDPADLWRDDKPALIRAVEHAPRFLQFKLERALAGADLSTPEGRARAAEAVVPVLGEHPSELVREGYIQDVAGRIGVDHAWFKDAIARARSPRHAAAPPDAPTRPAAGPSVDRREADVLRWAIHEPQLVVDWLDASLFSDATARATFEQLVAADSFRDALDASEGQVRSLLERLAVEEPIADADTQTVRTRLMINMAEPAAKQLLGRLLEEEDARATKLGALLDDVAHAREVTWTAAQEAAEQLVTLTVALSRDGRGEQQRERIRRGTESARP
jgi:DNA primase